MEKTQERQRESKERERAPLVSTPPPGQLESKSKSCCISVLLCCDVAQAEPGTEQAALRTSSQTQDQPSLFRAGDPLPATSLATTACPRQRHVPWREPGVWRGSHCGLPWRDLRLCRPHSCHDPSLQPLHPWLLLCSGRPRTTLRWQPSVPGQWAYQSSCVCALQPPAQPLYAPAQPALSGNHFNTRLQVREIQFFFMTGSLEWRKVSVVCLAKRVIFIDSISTGWNYFWSLLLKM